MEYNISFIFSQDLIEFWEEGTGIAPDHTTDDTDIFYVGK